MAAGCHPSHVKVLTWGLVQELFPDGQRVPAIVTSCTTDGEGTLESYAVITKREEQFRVFRCDDLISNFPHREMGDEWSVFITRQGRQLTVEHDFKTTIREHLPTKAVGPFMHTF